MSDPESIDAMIQQIEAWKEAEYQRLKADHAAKFGEQLDLVQVVEGIDMAQVRDYLLKLNAIEELLAHVSQQRTEIYAAMRDKGLPEKTIRSALKIARATRKRDTSPEVLDACVKLALSLLPEDEGGES